MSLGMLVRLLLEKAIALRLCACANSPGMEPDKELSWMYRY